MPSPWSPFLSAMRLTPQLERDSFIGKGNGKYDSQAFVALYSLQFHPIQRPGKLRCIETTRNKKERQRVPVSHSEVTCSVDDPSSFLHWRKQWLVESLWKPCQFLWNFAPRVFIIYLRLYWLPPLSARAETCIRSQPCLCSCVHSQQQPKSLRSPPPTCTHSGLAEGCSN